jgi:hypothetical protein
MAGSSDEYFYKNVIDTSSDEFGHDFEIIIAMAFLLHDQEQRLPKYRRSVKGRLPVTEHGRDEEHAQLWRDYFQRTNPIYKTPCFRRRFLISMDLFLKIMHSVRCYNDYLNLKADATCKLGFSSYQKCTAAIRMLAYGVVGDLVVEYIRMSESGCLEESYMICRVVVEVFAKVYLRQQNVADIARLLSINASRGFSGMLGSIDCMH